MPKKGETMSAEARERMAATKRGVWHTLTCDCGCGATFQRADHFVRVNKGSRFFLNLDHMHAFFRREAHPNFRGGMSGYGPEWDAIADTIRARDGVCQGCGKTAEENGRALDVHHKVPYRVCQNHNPANLITLCKLCHHQVGIAEEITYPPVKRIHCIVCGCLFAPPTPRRKICSKVCESKRAREYEKRYWDKQRTENTPAYQHRMAHTSAYGREHWREYRERKRGA